MAKKKNLKVSPEREAEIQRLFKEGLDEAAKDPEKYWEMERDRANKAKPWPGLEKDGDQEDDDAEGS